MTCDPIKHHRRSIRLPGYDYAQPGAYFLTIVTHNRECLFGNISEGVMLLNQAGQTVSAVWHELPSHYHRVELDTFVVMPNHVHGIIALKGPNVGAQHAAPLRTFNVPPGSLGTIVRSFKAAVTKRINLLRNTPGLPLWQRNYYEHILRTERDLDAIREYIQNNPKGWDTDEENPARTT